MEWEFSAVIGLGVAAFLVIHLIQLAALYFPLTYFGGLWTGAEIQGRHGWIAALLAAVVVLLLFTGIDGFGVLMQRQSPDLLKDQYTHALFATDNHLAIYLIDLVGLFLGFSLYGRCWCALRVRGQKEWLLALLVSVLLLVMHEAAESQLGVYSPTNPASKYQAT